MLSNEAVAQRLKAIDDVGYVRVEGDGYHYRLVVVSDIFLNKNKVARQQWVYRQLQDWIAEGRLHALSMETYTNLEWERKHG